MLVLLGLKWKHFFDQKQCAHARGKHEKGSNYKRGRSLFQKCTREARGEKLAHVRVPWTNVRYAKMRQIFILITMF